ncbi:MAG: carbon starvation CstA 5TM domain-containing protein, partial [Gemmatimonadota bacterium]
NQLLAGLSLLVLTLFLLKLGRRVWATAIPMAFLLVMTTWAMVLNLVRFVTNDQVLLAAVGGAIFVLELWLLFEAAAAVRRLMVGLSRASDKV